MFYRAGATETGWSVHSPAQMRGWNRFLEVAGLLLAAGVAFRLGCDHPSRNAPDSGAVAGSGGSSAGGTGGIFGSGGATGSGGSVGTGGDVGSGGASGTGGDPGSGGSVGTGGAVGST